MLNKDHNDLIKKQCKPGMFQIRFCDSKMNFFKHTILKWITAVLFPTYLKCFVPSLLLARAFEIAAH